MTYLFETEFWVLLKASSLNHLAISFHPDIIVLNVALTLENQKESDAHF